MKPSRRDYFWNSLGVTLQSAISPILLIAVTRINGVDDSGLFSYALAISLVFWGFAVWGGRTYQVSDLNREFSPYSYIMARILLASVTVAGSVIFCMVNGYDALKTSMIMVFVSFKMVESLSDVVYGEIQINRKLYITGVSLVIKTLVGSLVFIAIDLTTHNVLYASIGLTLVNIVIFFTFDMYFGRQAIHKITRKPLAISAQVREATAIIKRCAPIAVVLFLSLFSLNIPRYFVDMFHVEEVGYFGILAMPITVFVLLVLFLVQPNIIHLTESFNSGKYKEFKASVRSMVLAIGLIGLVGLVVGYFIGIPVMELIFGVNFSGYLVALLVIIAGGAANGLVSLYVTIFTIARRLRGLSYVLIGTNIVLTIACIPIVFQYGLLGSVILFTIVNYAQCALLFVIYEKLLADKMRTAETNSSSAL